MADRVLATGFGGLIGWRWSSARRAPAAADRAEVDGPSLAFVGSSGVWATGGAWGGGPAGPQSDSDIRWIAR
jgi:hypothetical protein